MSFITDFISRFTGSTIFVTGAGTRSRRHNLGIEQQEHCVAILDTNATHAAKGQALHVVKDSEGRIKEIKRNSEYTKLFTRPNPMMTRRDFLYAMAWQMMVGNIAFAWVKWDKKMHPVAVYPLVFLQFDIRKTESGEYCVAIRDNDGKETVVLMEDLIVLRRMYDGIGYTGMGNDALTNSIEMVQSLDDGLKKALEISNKIHGMVKLKNSMLVKEAKDKNNESFASRLEHASKHGGIVTLDSMEEYVPLNISTWAANAAQMKEITSRIYTYWRTPEEVVANTASEQVMQNYYDSIVEPIWETMQEAFTKALFTKKEQDFGNQIIMYSGAVTGASWQTKLNIIANTKDFGLLKTNEYRELLGYGPVEDGDERLISLNYVKASDQSLYQTGKTGGSDGQEDD